jgi:diacylglycerol/phytol O-acyltransferase
MHVRKTIEDRSSPAVARQPGFSSALLAGVIDVLRGLRHLRSFCDIRWSDATRDPRLIAAIERAFGGFHDRYFRVEVCGWDRIPGGPVLLVGNHSGFGVAELVMLLISWFRHFDNDRPVYALAHRWLYQTPFLRVAVPKIGGVPATWENACRVLGDGDVLAVFPGGELESTRPFAERYKVNLHGRHGFVRIALANDVSIVPMVTIGSHATMPMPPGMRALATITGARRYLGLHAVPLPLQLLVWALGLLAFEEQVIPAYLLLAVLLAAPPLYPSKMTTMFGTPIRPDDLRALGKPGADVTEAAFRHVERVMQGMMDRLAAERRGLFA